MNLKIIKKILNFSVALSFLTLFTNCMSVPSKTSDSKRSCPRQAEFDAKLKQIEPVIDSMVQGTNTTIPILYYDENMAGYPTPLFQ